MKNVVNRRGDRRHLVGDSGGGNFPELHLTSDFRRKEKKNWIYFFSLFSLRFFHLKFQGISQLHSALRASNGDVRADHHLQMDNKMISPWQRSLKQPRKFKGEVSVIHNSHLDPQINHRDGEEEEQKTSKIKCIAPHTRFAFIRRCLFVLFLQIISASFSSVLFQKKRKKSRKGKNAKKSWLNTHKRRFFCLFSPFKADLMEKFFRKLLHYRCISNHNTLTDKVLLWKFHFLHNIKKRPKPATHSLLHTSTSSIVIAAIGAHEPGFTMNL